MQTCSSTFSYVLIAHFTTMPSKLHPGPTVSRAATKQLTPTRIPATLATPSTDQDQDFEEGRNGDIVYAMIPRIDSELGLDAEGNFAYADLSQSDVVARQSSRSKSGMHDSELEDRVADKRKGMSFAEIDRREKRAVFQLGPVRRAMRHLPYSAILMREDVMQTARRYSETLFVNCQALPHP